MTTHYSARFDTLDFRDRLFAPTLVEVPPVVRLEDYVKRYPGQDVPILDQGTEWSCTGHGLAALVHYLLRTRKENPDLTAVSPRMLYEMAKRFDEYSGVRYRGSSARGAMKGWQKFGVCSRELWPYRSGQQDRHLTEERAKDAIQRPLGAYFRVNHKDLVAMHAALAEVGILYAVASVHDGWEHPGPDGRIPPSERILGGHAIAIVAYDDRGFWIQNSRGRKWGREGFGYLSYDDWLENGRDVWVGRLGVPVKLGAGEAAAGSRAPAPLHAVANAIRELRPHILSIADDGLPRADATFGTSEDDIQEILSKDLPQITRSWKGKRKRVLLYVDGTLAGEEKAAQRAADYRETLLQHEIYPLVVSWRTELWPEITDLLIDAARRRRPDQQVGGERDFLMERLSDSLEPLVRRFGGRMTWEEWKRTAMAASADRLSAGRRILEQLAPLVKKGQVELHAAAHGAGSVLLAPLVRMFTARRRIQSGPLKGRKGFNQPLGSCTLWAPACTLDLFTATYLFAVNDRRIRRFRLFTLTDEAERQDNCGGIYRRSLLYLISNALEENPSVPGFSKGEPLAGLQRSIDDDPDLAARLRRPPCRWVLAPNTRPAGSAMASHARRHGDFDDDKPTLLALLATILDRDRVKADFRIHRSASSTRHLRRRLWLT